MMGARSFLMAAVSLIVLAAPAHAESWGDGVQVMPDAEMADLRGGFEIAGLDINFGAVITTYVDGTPALSTQLTWTDTGALVQQTVGSLGQQIDQLTPAARTALGLDGVDGSGVVISDAAGVTALVHNVTNGALQNIIINNASGRNLAQDVDVTLTLPGFDVIQQALQTQAFGIHINDDMSAFTYDPGS